VRVIFASGSPFPIFPAHRLTLRGQDVSLVDGGYSNNVPVDAARTVSAEQVLIVESSNPLRGGSEPSGFGRAVLGVRGKLVENLGRLPGFLLERSQEVDRLSRRDLFVVSISPSREEVDWPPLFDFRRKTVQRMEKVATADLTRRVGMVQSWGRPSFALSVEVEGQRTEEPPHDHEGEEQPHV
jgi:predicted acylesterase/phospholipase RssA